MFTVQTIYCVHIDLKLELPINVRRYFDYSKQRGEGNSDIFINREILPGAEDSLICFTIVLKITMDFSEIQRRILFIMNICEILLFILFLLYFIFFNFKYTMCGIYALRRLKIKVG